MGTRRQFLATLIAGAALPGATWADAGAPAYLAAAMEPDGTFALFGLTDEGADTFRIPLPARGHAAAAHPDRPEAVAFARRPGTFALVIDCAAGLVRHRLNTPDGQHFSGHGTFSATGDVLYTAEAMDAGGQGRIGLWDAARGYARLGDMASGGIGPHEILRLPGSDTLVVANGGIIATLDDDRTKLNLDTMAPTLGYLAPDGAILEQVALPASLHRNSIRHLAAHPDGTVAFAMQWEGDADVFPPLLGLHRQGAAPVLCHLPDASAHRPQNYAGSVAFSGDGRRVGIACPRGGVLALFDAAGGEGILIERADVCGLALSVAGMIATDGFGGIVRVGTTGLAPLAARDRAWDNHLVRL